MSLLEYFKATPGVHSIADDYKPWIIQIIVAQIELYQGAGFVLQSFPDTYAAQHSEAAVVHPAKDI